MNEKLTDQVLELIRRSSTDLQPDVERALQAAYDREDAGSSARGVLDNILTNIRMARAQSTPICQDTGTLMFEVDYPRGTDERPIVQAIEQAAAKATKAYYLRPNAVDSLTGKNSGNNLGIHTPVVHLNPSDGESLRVRLLQKGGGSENVSATFRLPDSSLGAGRDLKGVRKVVLKAVFDAQGKGCAPGIVAVGLGGDRATGMLLAKQQLFRKLGQRSEQPELAALEEQLLQDINTMGIGPMGLGGKTTALDVFIGAQHRHPATFFVSIAYMCWACRRGTMTVHNGEVTYD